MRGDVRPMAVTSFHNLNAPDWLFGGGSEEIFTLRDADYRSAESPIRKHIGVYGGLSLWALSGAESTTDHSEGSRSGLRGFADTAYRGTPCRRTAARVIFAIDGVPHCRMMSVNSARRISRTRSTPS